MAGRQSDVDRPGIWFTNEDGYVNSFEEVKKVIDDFKVRTRSRFVMYSSNASFGKTGRYYTCHKSTPVEMIQTIPAVSVLTGTKQSFPVNISVQCSGIQKASGMT